VLFYVGFYDCRLYYKLFLFAFKWFYYCRPYYKNKVCFLFVFLRGFTTADFIIIIRFVFCFAWFYYCRLYSKNKFVCVFLNGFTHYYKTKDVF